MRELQLRLRASAVNGYGPRRGEIAKLPLPKTGAALVPVMAGVSDIIKDRGALLQASLATRHAQGISGVCTRALLMTRACSWQTTWTVLWCGNSRLQQQKGRGCALLID